MRSERKSEGCRWTEEEIGRLVELARSQEMITPPPPTEPRVTLVPLEDQRLVAVYRALQLQRGVGEVDLPGALRHLDAALLKSATDQTLASLALLAPDDLRPVLGLDANEANDG